MEPADALSPHDRLVHEFWERARPRVEGGHLPILVGRSITETIPPPSFSFMDQDLCDLVLAGRKTATSSAFGVQDELPAKGDLSILLDDAGTPRALLVTTQVDVAPFDQVSAEHAAAEGEGDLGLDTWRVEHERFFRSEGTYDPQMDILLERFAVLYQE